MKNNLIQTEVDVKGSTIKVLRIDGYEYISLTDLAKTQKINFLDRAPKHESYQQANLFAYIKNI